MFFKTSYNYYNQLILILLFCLIEFIIDPIGNFPLNDDWWYAKTLQHFLDHRSGFISWSSSTQVGQTFSALFYAKLFGSTFTVLRFYTLTLSLIGILFFYSLCAKFIFNDRSKALIASLVLLLGPFYLSLSNSFMTEIPFITFLVISLYFYFSYRSYQKWLHLSFSLLFMSLAVLTRQVALAFAVGIVLSEFIQNRSSLKRLFLFILIPLILLFAFEVWLKSKDALSAYPFVFSSNGNYKGAVSLTDFIFNVSKRWIHFVTIIGFTLSPLLIASFIHSIQNIRSSYFNNKSIISLLVFGVVLLGFKNFPIGNYLYNCGVGPDTLYDSYLAGINNTKNSSHLLFSVITVITLICSFQLIYLGSGSLIDLLKVNNSKTKSDHFLWVFFVSLIFYYLFYCYSSAILDRYIFIAYIPLIFILVKEVNRRIHKPSLIIFICLLALFSTFSTKDYLNFNKARWEAIANLKKNNKVSNADINGGFEHEGFYFSDTLDWVAKWRNVHPHKYMIAHGNLKNYIPIQYKVYQRYIPFKKDSIYVLEHVQ